MKYKIVITALILAASAAALSVFPVSSDKTYHLFFIQSNDSKNAVQYDVRLMDNDDLFEPNPVEVYWILGNGKQEKLNLVEKKFAYGIKSQKKLEKNKFRIIVAALKNREIIIERVNDSYRPLISINGEYSILKKVYISSIKGLVGLPKVNYIDLIGWNINKKLPTTERIIPGNGSIKED